VPDPEELLGIGTGRDFKRTAITRVKIPVFAAM
jgi:hypothetical protein